MKAAAVLMLAGVFVAAQVLRGGALDRILSGAPAASPSTGGGATTVPLPPHFDPGPTGAPLGPPGPVSSS